MTYPSQTHLSDEFRAKLLSAATLMANHPQDHGWRPMYRDIAEILRTTPTPLMELLPRIPGVEELTPAYVVGLLAISLQRTWHELNHFSSSSRRIPSARITPLAASHKAVIETTLAAYRNSFTGVRRFLVPQVLLARYFSGMPNRAINVLDIGTGIGLLPRQLDSKDCFDRFKGELLWLGNPLEFSRIGVDRRVGIELEPIPDIEWVRSCYGPSDYYDDLFEEIREALDMPDVRDARYVSLGQDARDIELLKALMASRDISAVTALYSLYQYSWETRNAIETAVHESLPIGGVFISIEPDPTLSLPGCVARVRIGGVDGIMTVCLVSDGHFRGNVEAGPDYTAFWEGHRDGWGGAR